MKKTTSAGVQRKTNADSTKLYRKPPQQQLKAIQGFTQSMSTWNTLQIVL